jgi:hypothetical protein
MKLRRTHAVLLAIVAVGAITVGPASPASAKCGFPDTSELTDQPLPVTPLLDEVVCNQGYRLVQDVQCKFTGDYLYCLR